MVSQDSACRGQPLQVLHVIDNLRLGGAQALLRDLVALGDSDGLAHRIAVLGASCATTEFACPVHFYNSPKWSFLGIVPWISGLVRSYGVTNIISHLYKSNLLCAHGADSFGVPVAIFDHSDSLNCAATATYTANSRLLAGAYQRLLLWSLLRCGADVLVVGQHLRASYLQRGVPSKQVTVLNGGVPCSRFAGSLQAARVRAELQIPPSAYLIVAAGRMSPEKNYASLIETVARLVAVDSEVYLLLVGDGPLYTELTRLVAAQKLPGRLLLPGRVANMPEVLAAADVFLHSSRNECFPIAVLEAMATGVPVVVAASEGAKSIVEDGLSGLLFPLGDGAAMAQALLRLRNDPELAGALAATGKKLVQEHYDISGFRQRIATFVRQRPYSK